MTDWKDGDDPNPRKSACIHGHPYTPENTIRARGKHECRTCRRNRDRVAKAARRRAYREANPLASPVHPLDRVLERVQLTPTDCWVWTGYGDRYGSVVAFGRRFQTHRYVYEQLVGPIPDGMTLDHLCRVTKCVNPDHLEVVTSRVNTLRGFSVSALNARKTHCPKGHPLDGMDGRGARICAECRRTTARLAYRAKTGSPGRLAA